MLTVLAIGAVVGAPAATTAPRFPTAAETRAELESFCDQITQGDNPYFGRAEVRELEGMLADAGEHAPQSIPLLGRLAVRHFTLGELDTAGEHFAHALRLAEGHAVGEPLVSQLVRDLALVRLQQGEDGNCLALHSAGSCLYPLPEDGVHRRPERAREAGDLLARYLTLRPDDATARWLLNLARMLTGDFPEGVPAPLRLSAGALRSEAAFPRWPDIAPALGVNALDLSGGAVMDDFDGDGLLDLVSSTWDPCDHVKAFRNDGAGGFEEVSGAWGLDGQLGGLNLVHADYDGDGMLDLLVLRGAWLGRDGRMRNSLLRNDLRRDAGRFVDVSAAAGVAFPAYPTQTAAFADYDGDGDLDLYVGNEAGIGSANLGAAGRDEGRAYASNLFRNQGDGTFTEVAAAAGVESFSFTKGVAWGDYDNDGDADLYVSAIGANRLYRNQGRDARGGVTFTDVAAAAGVREPSGRSFATWFFDFDHDGWLDLFVADYSAPAALVHRSYFLPPSAVRRGSVPGHPVLYRNRGDGTFADVSAAVGLGRPLLPMGANYGDLDGDGWLDLYLGTGIPDFAALMPNAMLRNDGGRRFLDITFAGGFGHVQKGHGIAFGDLDNDGDLDLFEQMGGAFPYDAYTNVLYQNPGPAEGHRWLVLRLEGRGANRFALGARIRVEVLTAGSRRAIERVVSSGGSFGGSSLQQEIGLGACERIAAVTVRWPGSGTVQTFTELALDRAYRLLEGQAEPRPLPWHALTLGGAPGRHPHPPGR